MNHRLLFLLLGCAAVLACGTPETPGTARTHLADRVSEAHIVAAPPTVPDALTWDLSNETGWSAIDVRPLPLLAPSTLEPTDEGAVLSLVGASAAGIPLRIGGVRMELEGLRAEDWESVLVEARTSDRFAGVTATANLEGLDSVPPFERFFASPDLAPPLFNDGSVQTYSLPLVPLEEDRPLPFEPETPARDPDGSAGPQPRPEGPLRNLALLFGAPGPAAVEVRSITLVPRGARYTEPAGRHSVTRAGTTRDALYARTPARLEFELDLPSGARLDTGLAVEKGDGVTYRVSTRVGDGPESVVFEEKIGDASSWAQRSIVLSAAAGRRATLVLEADGPDGAVGLWGAPIVTAAGHDRRADPSPNVVFYVIDGGDADLMSLYGAERPTTPYLEELAREGVLFTRAYSNSTWTQPSTVSFMTSLQHSVLGGLRRGVHSTAVPTNAVTMAERFRAAGYLTMSLTANPNAGRMIGLGRGVDLLRDTETEHHSTSSLELQSHFEDFLDAYPGSPWWVHFQTTDVHEPNEPVEPWAGRFVSPGERAALHAMDGRIWQSSMDLFGTTSIVGFYDAALARAGIDRHEYFGTRKGLYEETMLHQDAALRELVDGLKARDEWRNTILVIGSDHGHPAGTFARFGRGLTEPRPQPWQGALFDAWATRVPLLVLWPGHLEGGRTIDTPVSMIDVLPTLLELTGQPPAGVAQGHSLVPLLRGGTTEAPPVVLDEFRWDEESGGLVGNLEVVDGRWGASLEIRPLSEGDDPLLGRTEAPAGGRWGAVHRFYPQAPRLLLFDLLEDPFATRPVNDEYPEIVEREMRRLSGLWEAHRALSQRFAAGDAEPLTPEQLEQLRSLGYIQ